MKKCLPLMMGALFALSLTAATASAQDGNNSAKKMEQHKEKAEKRKEKNLEGLTKKLGLSADQQAQVKAILDEESKSTAELRKDYVEKMKALRTDSEAKVSAVLTPEQKTKFDALLAERKEKRQKHMMK